ncbi:hypothetical protein RDI58_022075 [Solanum bulbocastanum]|uniref:Uncharacterized protein n=1 Tax=Solanum bulbocastanum TaxID=147425 RepID=A0AAN8Y5R4_SOLBU
MDFKHAPPTAQLPVPYHAILSYPNMGIHTTNSSSDLLPDGDPTLSSCFTKPAEHGSPFSSLDDAGSFSRISFFPSYNSIRLDGHHRRPGPKQHSNHILTSSLSKFSVSTTRECQHSRNGRSVRDNDTNKNINNCSKGKVMVYKEKFDKKFLLVYPSNISKILIDIITPFNPDIGNYILVMNPTINNNPNVSTMTIKNTLVVTPTRPNRSMNLIRWNCRGGNGPDFRRNFRSLLDCHKPPLVVLLETKMQSHQVRLDDFLFNKMIEVPTIYNSGGVVIL